MNKYVTEVMKVLFTDEERNGGYIIEDKSLSKRRALDPDRVELLKSMFFSLKNLKLLIFDFDY